MNQAALSLAQTPPLSVPLRFMLTAPFFAVAAGLVLLVNPLSIFNRWSPELLAVTHLLTLGYVSMVMIGALQQLLPVLIGVRLRNPERISQLLHIGLVAGTLSLATGLLYAMASAILMGGLILGMTFSAFIAIVLSRLATASGGIQVSPGMKFSLISFMITVLAGLLLAAGHGFPGVRIMREYTDLHLAWGFLGWIALMIFTVSYQVIPMFQITPRYPLWMIRFLAPAMFVSLILLSLLISGMIDVPSLAIKLMTGLPAGGLVLYACVTLWVQSQRRRRIADVTLDYWRLGMLCLLAGLSLWIADAFMTSRIARFHSLMALLMVPGFVMSLIAGMLYKIIPFLVWLHLTNAIDMSQRWQKKIPNMKQIIPDQLARNQFRIHILALGLLIGSLWAPQWCMRVALLFFMASNLFLGVNLIRGARVFTLVLNSFQD